IIGCCEVVEEGIDVAHDPSSNKGIRERERRKSARPRPIIENLCVKRGYRRSGVGVALVRACENAVRLWSGQDEVFAQVEEDNVGAMGMFRSCKYHKLFADPTCSKVELDDALFAREITTTKWMMRKILEEDNSSF
ncbi:hypothetical protein ACHAWF_007863, partial [Thalassiosira exigua]